MDQGANSEHLRWFSHILPLDCKRKMQRKRPQGNRRPLAKDRVDQLELLRL